MKYRFLILIIAIILMFINACKQQDSEGEINIIFLHHSTGYVIWRGGNKNFISRVAARLSDGLADRLEKKAALPAMIEKHNKKCNANYQISEIEFPKVTPYGWNNNPYDYYNIWVKNAGENYFMEEPTLEILTKNYQVIIFKHCYPVSNIQPDTDSADIDSDKKTLSNYKLQYSALRDKLHEFPDTKFILFTGAAQVKSKITEDEAERAREFFTWVIEVWDLPDDNIYLWDLYKLETEGGLYFLETKAVSSQDSHPNADFASNAVILLFNRITDIIENNGKTTTLTGEFLKITKLSD